MNNNMRFMHLDHNWNFSGESADEGHYINGPAMQRGERLGLYGVS